MIKKTNQFVALGSRLKGVPEVLTLGVKPNFMDYSEEERGLIAGAAMILYPTANYAQFFTTLGKPFFPSLETCLYADEKIKQSTLFSMVGIPHPRTRFYYHLHHRDILGDFSYPFVAKLPRASSRGRGVYKIENPEQLNAYLRLTPIAYIQEYLPHDRDLRVILVNYEPILSYWRQREPSNFRTNLHQGGTPLFFEIPYDALSLAQDTALRCKFNDVGLDLIQCRGKWYVIEANMEYGREGLRMRGMNLKEILREKLLSGELMPAPSGQGDGATAGRAGWVV
ncbi:MAG: RimK family alpha-L-glutamate ligase [Deltaproteobacteria bacterium]|nr:RimK family alpha-L-glutamate ligase [Deltaproteobacteria bacterium]